MVIPIRQNSKGKIYRKDLAYLKFALSLLNTVLKDDSLENKYKKIKQRADRRIENIILEGKKLLRVVDKYDSLYADDQLKKLFRKLEKKAPKNQAINLDIFSIYIMYLKFKDERKDPLDSDFDYFANVNKLFSIVELVEQFDKKESEAEYKLAQKMVRVL